MGPAVGDEIITLDIEFIYIGGALPVQFTHCEIVWNCRGIVRFRGPKSRVLFLIGFSSPACKSSNLKIKFDLRIIKFNYFLFGSFLGFSRIGNFDLVPSI